MFTNRGYNFAGRGVSDTSTSGPVDSFYTSDARNQSSGGFLETSSTYSNTKSGGAPGDGGFLIGATQTDTGAAARRSTEDGNQIHPLKISMIHQSFVDNPQNLHLRFLDDEVTMFKLVGVILTLDIDEVTERWTFLLDDGSGQIVVEWLSREQRDYSEDEPSPWMRREQARIVPYSYVRVYGQLNLLGKTEPHVSTFFVSRVDIAEEVFFHETQVAEFLVRKLYASKTNNAGVTEVASPARKREASALKPEVDSLANMESGFSTPSGAASVSSRFPPPYEVNNQVTTSTIGPSTTMSTLAGLIKEILKNMAGLQPQGLTELELAAQLAGRGLATSNEELQRECRQLANCGIIFSSVKGRWKVTGV